jgi:hypothetical protein
MEEEPSTLWVILQTYYEQQKVVICQKQLPLTCMMSTVLPLEVDMKI